MAFEANAEIQIRSDLAKLEVYQHFVDENEAISCVLLETGEPNYLRVKAVVRADGREGELLIPHWAVLLIVKKVPFKPVGFVPSA